ncbi:MAG: chloride channel protein [Velocimicrobium sp.]
MLLRISELRDSNINIFVPLLPLAGIAILFLYRQYSKESIKGMALIFQAGHGDCEKIPKMLIPLAMISTWSTHLFWGNAGREGVAVQLGAAIAHTIGRILKLPNNSRVLLITGMAAGSICYEALFPTLAACTNFNRWGGFRIRKYLTFCGDSSLPDEGACVALGMSYMYKQLVNQNILLIGLHTDKRGAYVDSKLNPMLEASMDSIFESVSELLEYLSDL